MYLLISILSFVGQDSVNYDATDISCIDLVGLRATEFVINSDHELKEFVYKARRSFPFKYLPPGTVCEDFPAIEFNEKTLIGYTVMVGGCNEPTWDMTFLQRDGEYYMHVEVGENGSCRALFTKSYWIIADKIEHADLIHFEKNHHK
ncbi:MAG: hypothetical protein RJQ09_11920 [Cyclobacteriaceae bacterium]